MKKILTLLICLLGFGMATANAEPMIFALSNSTPYISINSLRLNGSDIEFCYTPENVSVRILMYHYVRHAHRDPKGSVVAGNSVIPEIFEKQMSVLSTAQILGETHVMFMSEFEKAYNLGCFPNKDITIITSDDGRWDNYGLMYPILERYNIKANYGIIYNRTSRTKERIDPFMTVDEIKGLLSSGLIEVSSHSISHININALSYQKKYDEICNSKAYLEEIFDISINTFIYPMGFHDITAQQIAESCGYTFALTTLEGMTTPNRIKSSPFKVNRIRVSNDTSMSELLSR